MNEEDTQLEPLVCTHTHGWIRHIQRTHYKAFVKDPVSNMQLTLSPFFFPSCCVHVYTYMCGHALHRMHTEVRGSRAKVGSFLSTMQVAETEPSFSGFVESILMCWAISTAHHLRCLCLDVLSPLSKSYTHIMGPDPNCAHLTLANSRLHQWFQE